MIALAGAHLPALAADLPACMLGRWKSNEELTLADMARHPEVTEKARVLFSNHFFGRLVNVNGPRHQADYFIEDKDKPIEFVPIHVAESTEDSAVIEVESEALGHAIRTSWFCENGLIYALTSRWNFREYFSPY